MSAQPGSVTVFTRSSRDATGVALRRVIQLGAAAGIEVRVPPDEVERHGLNPGDGDLDGAVLGADPDGPTDLALVLGGDGTILSTLRLYAGRGVPVFAINYGAIGFLSTVEHEQLDEGIQRALTGDFDVMELPGLVTRTEDGERLALNDISFHRRSDARVAELAYSVEGEQLGAVRCDGLVVSTPAGSTGYNLANGGPVLAWGVEGYVVSFIAPHTLTARALVVAPGDSLEVANGSDEHPLEVQADGRAVCDLPPRGSMPIRFEHRRALLAQAPGATFYHRMRDKFGRLAY